MRVSLPMRNSAYPADFAFEPGDRFLLAAGVELSLYDYPAGGNAVGTLSLESVGVAVVPTAQVFFKTK